ncbi:TetR/AcrR family transcriptional regulator [Granulicoccus phenolivorans]|uniref:TetR/AcrR family transcriptional regulator n=1 Tax=Granulicoccus phenolivorans TaxID=266854 RepID=UPI000415C589|nr:TetR family transcriptional regulator [Granulicoccus phenolivorans]
MGPRTRERSLEAAVELVGTDGVRALTHGRVDQRAGLPPGSASNWFRTRRALLAALVDWIAERERADLDPGALPPISDPDSLIAGMCAMFEVQAGPFATRTRARYALFLDVSHDPELFEPLRRQRLEVEQWAEVLVRRAGIPDPASATRTLMALGDGLMLHRLTVDPNLDARPFLERGIRDLARPRTSAPD